MLLWDKHIFTSKIYYIDYIDDYKTCEITEINYDNYNYSTWETI